MEELLYWIWLSKIPGLGSITTQRLLKIYSNPKEIWKETKEKLQKIEGIGEKIAQQITNKEYRKNLEEIANRMEQEKITLITLQDKDYPENLKHLYDKPISLYVKGDKKLLNQFSLALIGCRENSIYGKKVAIAISKGLARRKIITVSGLARGIDSISHQATLGENGKTIAVIGSGIENIYPKQNENLAKEIIKKGGAIVSEYAPTTRAERMNFPARNRIISGLSMGVIVIEAKKKSGTMSTVDFALEQGKAVFAVPGNITSKNAEGSNALLKQGAKCVTCMQDILEEYGVEE